MEHPSSLYSQPTSTIIIFTLIRMRILKSLEHHLYTFIFLRFSLSILSILSMYLHNWEWTFLYYSRFLYSFTIVLHMNGKVEVDAHNRLFLLLCIPSLLSHLSPSLCSNTKEKITLSYKCVKLFYYTKFFSTSWRNLHLLTILMTSFHGHLYSFFFFSIFVSTLLTITFFRFVKGDIDFVKRLYISFLLYPDPVPVDEEPSQTSGPRKS